MRRATGFCPRQDGKQNDGDGSCIFNWGGGGGLQGRNSWEGTDNALGVPSGWREGKTGQRQEAVKRLDQSYKSGAVLVEGQD